MGWLRSYALPLDQLLRGHSKIHRALHAHTLAKILMDLGARESKEILDLESLRLRARTDLNSKTRMAVGGVKPSYRSIL